MKKFKFGVIGAGFIGKMHIENIAYKMPEAEVVAISDVFEERVKQIAFDAGIPMATTNYKDILANEDVDAVIVCSSTNTHVPISIEAAEAGKHVFCEKPIATALKDCDLLIDAVKKNEIVFQVGFNRRFDPSFKKMHDEIVSGRIGVPHIMKITSRDPEPPTFEYQKNCGGIFLDMSIHDLDMAHYMAGSKVEEVYVTGSVLIVPDFKKINDIDTALISMKFENGMIGVIDNSMEAVYGYDQRIEMFGSKGMIEAKNAITNNLSYFSKDGISKENPPYFFIERYTEAYLSELRAFIDSVKNGTPSKASVEDGKYAIELCIACKKSLDEHRAVKMSEIF